MNIEFNLENTIVLFGAIQGFTLCFFMRKQRSVNQPAYLFFVLFLASLAFFNLTYALHYSHIYKIGFLPLTAFPLPYKYLIGPGFYFYIKSLVREKDKLPFYRKEIYLFLPALLYGILRSYWYIIAILEDSPRIMLEVFDSGFFTVNEVAYLLFDLFLILAAIRFLLNSVSPSLLSTPNRQNLTWILLQSKTFLTLTVFNLLYISIMILLDLEESKALYSFILLVNVAFIYWIGYKGFSRSGQFFPLFSSNNKIVSPKKNQIKTLLHQAIEIDEEFRNPKLTIATLAVSFGVSTKELSAYINETHQVNFSEYLSHYRIEKVKKLLRSPKSDKYTLIALANEAGFSSKSSFNATFKKLVGVTPSAYKKGINT